MEKIQSDGISEYFVIMLVLACIYSKSIVRSFGTQTLLYYYISQNSFIKWTDYIYIYMKMLWEIVVLSQEDRRNEQ